MDDLPSDVGLLGRASAQPDAPVDDSQFALGLLDVAVAISAALLGAGMQASMLDVGGYARRWRAEGNASRALALELFTERLGTVDQAVADARAARRPKPRKRPALRLVAEGGEIQAGGHEHHQLNPRD